VTNYFLFVTANLFYISIGYALKVTKWRSIAIYYGGCVSGA